jgi:hypothetical protein
VATATKVRETMEVEIDCPYCDEHGRSLAAKYTRPNDHGILTGCNGCGGSRKLTLRYRIPAKTDKVEITDKDLLTAIFGEGKEPEAPGVVFDTQMPEEHGLELKTGLCVRVTWDALKKDGNVPKGAQVDLWTFDLSEIKLV